MVEDREKIDFRAGTYRIALVSSAEVTTEHALTVFTYENSQALTRAGGFFAFVYTFGVISLLSPFFHIFPPVWIIIAPVVAGRIYRYYSDVVRIAGTRPICPACHEEVWLPLRRRRMLEEFNCRACGDHVTVRWLDSMPQDHLPS